MIPSDLEYIIETVSLIITIPHLKIKWCNFGTQK